jgi:O-antigen/teichoic acid export membrane protein
LSSVRKALLFSSGSQYLSKILNFGFIVAIVRILSPDELGVFAIATSIVMIVTEFRLLGTTNYLVREKVVTPEIIRSGVGLTVIICWVLGATVFLAATAVGNFYDVNALVTIFRILSISFFFAPFISVTNSILTRELKFHHLMYANLAVLIVKIIATIALVLMGYSYYGLAWGVVIGTICEFIVYRMIKPDIVSWRPIFKNFSPIIKFGVYSSLINIMSRFEAAAADIIIGKAGTPTQVAMFSRGTGFLTFVSEIVTAGVWQVALPHLSQVSRDGGELSKAYIRASLLLGSLVWPVLAVAGLASYPAIILIFGEQWIDSVPLISILSGWAILKAIHALSSPVLFSSGNEKILLKKQTAVFVGAILAITVSISYGLEAVAWSLVGLGLFDFIITSRVLKTSINLPVLTFISKMTPNIILVSVCYIVALIIDYLIDFDLAAPINSFLILTFVMPIVWLATVVAIKHPIYDELSPVFNYLKKWIRSNKN